MRQSSGVSHLQPSTKFQKSSNESFNKGGISERMGGGDSNEFSGVKSRGAYSKRKMVRGV